MHPGSALSPSRFLSFALILLISVSAVAYTFALHANSSQDISQTTQNTPQQISPKESALFVKVANLMRTDKEAALKQLLKSLKKHHSAVLYFMAGDLLQQNGYTNDALAYFHIAVEKQPDFRIALRSAGIIEAHIKNYDRARELLLRALDASGSPDHVTFGTLGHCYENLEDFETAEAFYREAIQLKPDYRGWQTGLAKALKGQVKHQEANDLLEALGPEASL